MSRFLGISNDTLFWYYVTSNIAYLIMLVVALKTTARHHHLLESYRLGWMKETSLAPPMTIIVPAHNEQKSIRVSVRKLLELDYPELQIVVVNDGSEDRTLEEMQQEFHLRPVRAIYVHNIKSAPLRGLYRSDTDPALVVVDKEAAGSKADAVNAGLNAATSPYVCVVDADSVLESDALLRIMLPVVQDPELVVAVGGIVRVLNGSGIRGGQLRGG